MKRILAAAVVAAALWVWVVAAAVAQAPAPKLELTEEQKKAEEAFSLADGLYRKGFYDRALEKLTEFVAAYPKHANAPMALLEAGECHYAQKKYAEALPLYQRVLAEYPASGEMDDAAYRLGQCKFGLGDYPGAVAALQDLVQRAADTQYRPAAFYWIGESQFRLGRFAEAIVAYQESRRLAPKGQYAAYAVYSVGVSQQQLSKPQDALASFRTVLQEYADSPVAAESEVRLAEALHGAGQDAEAEKAFQNVVKRGQTDVLPQALHGLAWCQFDGKRWPEAQATFERLVKDYPASDLAKADRRRIADCLYHEGKFADAARAYEAALPVTAADQAPDVLLWQAAAYEQAGDRDQAAASYQRLTKDYPSSPAAAKAALRLAETLADKKDLDGAEKAYHAAAAAADPALKAQGELGLAWVVYQRGDAPGALAQYERLGRADPSSSVGGQALLQGAKIALALKDPAKAADLAGLLLQKSPAREGAAEAHYLLGLARASAGDRQTAANELAQAVQGTAKADFTADALGRLAQLYRQLGDNAHADATLARLKQDFPQSGAGARAQYDTASELLKTGKFAEARHAYEAALAAAGDPATTALCRLGIGNTHFQEGHFDLALAAFRLAAEKQPPTEVAEAAAFQIGACLARLDKPAEAAPALEQFLAKYPQSDLAPQATAELAWSTLRAGDKDKAAALYEKLLAAPGTPATVAAEGLFRLGEIAYDRGDYEKALTRYTEISTKYPQSDLVDEAQYKRAWTLVQLKRTDESQEAFRQCLTAKPSPEIAADCHFRLASALAAKGQVDPALAELAGFRNEYRAAPVAPFALLLLAQLAARKSDWAGAEAAARAAPETGEDWYRDQRALVLGQALRAQKKTEEAVKLLDLATRSKDANTAAAAQFELASALAESGQHARAADGFLNVALVHGESSYAPQALYEAGQCFERAGAKEDAKKAYQGVLKDYPQAAEWVEKAKARLQALGG